jgi:excisionase family DNA binding protein
VTTATIDAPPLARLLTAAEVADALGVTVERVWELTREGKIPAVKFGGRTYRYHPARVASAVEELET